MIFPMQQFLVLKDKQEERRKLNSVRQCTGFSLSDIPDPFLLLMLFVFARVPCGNLEKGIFNIQIILNYMYKYILKI